MEEWLLQLRERKERESDLDLVLCHANPLCQLLAFLPAWGFALVKKFLQLELLFLGIYNAHLLLYLRRFGGIFLVVVGICGLQRVYRMLKARTPWRT